MDLRRVRYFVGVADALSFSRAAARLHVSQPALSRQIKELESELGVRLFNRVARRIALTGEGEDLVARCRALLSSAESLQQRANVLAGGHGGILRIGATAVTIETVLPNLLTRFRRRRQGVDIHLIQDGGRALLARVEQGDLQLALTRLPTETHLRSHPLFPVQLLAALPRSHPLGRLRSVDVANLAGEPLLALPRGFTSRELLEEACGASRMRPNIVFESDMPQSLISLAAVGFGLAIVPSITRRRPGIRFVPITHSGAPLGVSMAVIWDPRRFLPPYAEAFIEQAVAAFRRSYPGTGIRPLA